MRCDGVASFGRRPMFDTGAVLLEVHLFDFSGDLYGRTIDVAFIGWLREEMTFASLDESRRVHARGRKPRARDAGAGRRRLSAGLARSHAAMSDLDVIVIGAGHNGLVCAAYLGMAGLRVRVLERRAVIGGACVTEEICPGFRNSTAAYAVSLLQPKVIRDLRLARAWPAHRRAPGAEFPAAAGRTLSAHRRGPQRTRDRQIQPPRCPTIWRVPGRDRPRRIGAARPRAQGTAKSAVGKFHPQPGRTRQARGRGQAAVARGGLTPGIQSLAPFGRRNARRLVRVRPDQGGARLRRGRRQPRQPLYAELRLRAPASCLRRGERQAGRMGTRARRHGSDHASDGQGRSAMRRAHRCALGGARDHRRARPRRRHRARRWHRDPRRRDRRQCRSAIAVPARCCRAKRFRPRCTSACRPGRRAPARSA